MLSVVIPLLAACGHSGENHDMVGKYIMISVNGEALPFTTHRSADAHERIVAGTLVLEASGAVEFVTEVELTMVGITAPRSDQTRGTYDYSGDVINLELPNAPEAKLIPANDEMTFQAGDLLLVYRRSEP